MVLVPRPSCGVYNILQASLFIINRMALRSKGHLAFKPIVTKNHAIITLRLLRSLFSHVSFFSYLYFLKSLFLRPFTFSLFRPFSKILYFISLSLSLSLLSYLFYHIPFYIFLKYINFSGLFLLFQGHNSFYILMYNNMIRPFFIKSLRWGSYLP